MFSKFAYQSNSAAEESKGNDSDDETIPTTRKRARDEDLSDYDDGWSTDEYVAESAPSSCRKIHKHGGKRNTVTYEQKTHCSDEAVVAEFLKQTRCGCDQHCLRKLANLEDAKGKEVVLQIRRQRFAGIFFTNPHLPTERVRDT